MQEEQIANVSDLTGKFYKPKSMEYWYILKVLCVYDTGEVKCEAIAIHLNKKKTKICIGEVHSLSEYHINKCEIKKEEFGEAQRQALEIISSYG